MLPRPSSEDVTRKKVSLSLRSSTLHSAGPSLSARLLVIDIVPGNGLLASSSVDGRSLVWEDVTAKKAAIDFQLATHEEAYQSIRAKT